MKYQTWVRGSENINHWFVFIQTEREGSGVDLHQRRITIIEPCVSIRGGTIAQSDHWFTRLLAEDVVQAFADYYGWQIPCGVTQLLDRAHVLPVMVSS